MAALPATSLPTLTTALGSRIRPGAMSLCPSTVFASRSPSVTLPEHDHDGGIAFPHPAYRALYDLPMSPEILFEEQAR